MSLLRKSLHVAGKQLVIIAGITAAIILLLIGSGAWLSKAVAERKDEIAAWASEHTGYQIEVGEASLYWLDFIPKLMLADVNVMTQGSERPIFRLASLYVGADVLDSIEQRQPVIDTVSISGLQLAVMRDAEGQFSVRNLDWQPEKSDSDNTWQSALNDLEHLRLQSISLDYQDAVNPNFGGFYQLQYADLTQSGDWVSADIDLTLPQHLGKALSVHGEVKRDGDNFSAWEMVVNGSELQLATFLENRFVTSIGIEQGRADIKVSVTKQDDEISANGLAKLQNGSFYQQLNGKNPDGDSSPVQIDSLDTQFNWLQIGNRWQLDLQSLNMAVNGQVWPEVQLRAQQDDAQQVELQSNFLRLSDITAAVNLSDAAPAWLKSFSPVGDVYDLHLIIDKNQQVQLAKARVNELGFQQNDDIPGVSGLSFTLNWDHNLIDAQIDSRDVGVYAQAWLAESVYLDSIRGGFQWQIKNQGGELNISSLQLVNDDLNISVAGRLDTADTLDADLRLNIDDFNAANWLAYVPERVLEPQFLRWARTAFVAGRVEQAELTLKGNPQAFPFDEQPDAGSFSMQMSVNDVELNYGNDWPNLVSVDGQISGSGNDLVINATSGQTAGFNFNNVNANITNLVNGQPILTVDGLLNGPAQQGLLFLKNSPLASRFGPIADWLSLSNNNQLELNLMVPLLDPDATEVNGEILLSGNGLILEAMPEVEFTDVAGQIHFDNDGLSAENVTANFAGQPAKVDIKPFAGNTRIQVNSAFNVAELANRWQLDLPNGISGNSDIQANIDIAETQPGDFKVAVGLLSDLQGVAIDLPEPFNKVTTQSLPLEVTIHPEDKVLIDIHLDEWITAAIEVANEDVRAGIAIGQQRAELPNNGIAVAGSFDSLSISDWQKWWQENSGNTQDSTFQPDVIAFTAAKLDWQDWQFNDVSVSAQKQPSLWQIAISAQQLKGDVTWPVNNDGIPSLNFDFVTLVLPDDALAGEKSNTKPDLWPSFNLNIDALTIDEMKLGHLQAEALRQGLRWKLVSATLQSEVLQAQASGDWRRTDQGDHTDLKLQVNSDDLAGLFTDLGYQPAISARQVNVETEVKWSGSPLDINFSNLIGEMQLDVGRGELTEVEPGAAGRIFGLMSFTAIPRRLALDFSDLFGSGFGFSRINGRFDFKDGLATTNNLQMRGDSALISVTGPINLMDRTYNQTVQITPSVSSTLPLAGAVAGGPIGLGVGTAIFLVDKLASNLFDREIVDIITYRYQLTGPWDSPNMKLQTAEQP